jgi:glycine/D-amino acid oxidase-like deaminating enzyme
VLKLESDVLVIGGGMAAAWAAIGAAREGASVVLVDKGYVGTSGVTATAGPGHWYVPPEKRAAAIAQREAIAYGLGDASWMARILDQTYRTLPTLEGHYHFGLNDKGEKAIGPMRGPEYMRALRSLAAQLGVRIFDQSPALELLLHSDGSAAGARGLRRQLAQPYEARAAGVILATGGCAFLSRLLGSQTNTGDGYLTASTTESPTRWTSRSSPSRCCRCCASAVWCAASMSTTRCAATSACRCQRTAMRSARPGLAPKPRWRRHERAVRAPARRCAGASQAPAPRCALERARPVDLLQRRRPGVHRLPVPGALNLAFRYPELVRPCVVRARRNSGAKHA